MTRPPVIISRGPWDDDPDRTRFLVRCFHGGAQYVTDSFPPALLTPDVEADLFRALLHEHARLGCACAAPWSLLTARA
jgi:hypothetical protein